MTKESHTYRLDIEVYRKLQMAAKQTHRTPTEYMQRAIEKQIERDKEAGEIKGAK